MSNDIRLIEICEQVALDAKNDAIEFDGKPFTGKVVAEYFGNHGASIAALANVLKHIIQTQSQKDFTDNTIANIDNE